jgi:site-specific DNA-methyltransferase (adenine-specific)
MVNDPPYGIGWVRPYLKGAHNPAPHAGIKNDMDTSARDQALKAWGDKPALVFGSARAAFPDDWRRMLVFEKPLNSGLIGTRLPWFNNWEPIFLMGSWPDQTPTRSAVVKTSEPSASGYSGYATRAGHPHAKPQDVMTRLIEMCPPGVIADPFAGSGSTLIAARNLGRKAVGVELEESYCETIVKRLSQQAFIFDEVSA